ncbi:MAG: glycosyltransferase family 9 protein [Acidobacteria bacterium]|nr:glycosyltransferase family 9 protein [Acidobacteriota bacterium]
MEALGGFDSIVSWYGAARDDFRDAVRGLPFEFHTALPPHGCSCHAVDYYLIQAGAATGAIPRLPVTRRPQPFAVIHPFSGGRHKNWPLHRFRELARSLDMPVHFTAGPEEELDGAIRFDNLWDLAQWIATASLYIGNDSGITHLAAATGVPVVALFGPTDPAIWAPLGPNVSVLRAGRIQDLAVEQVLRLCVK